LCLVLALVGNGEVVIIQEDDLVFTEIYREGGEKIEAISCCRDYMDKLHILFEQSGVICYNNYNDDETYVVLADGTSPEFGYMEDSCYYIYIYKDIYNYFFIAEYEFVLYNDGFNYYELTMITGSVGDEYIYATSDRGGDLDIWRLTYYYEDFIQITDTIGEETDINAWDKYVVFVRTVDGQSDIYIVKVGYR